MRTRSRHVSFAAALLLVAAAPAQQRAPRRTPAAKAGPVPRMADGKPDMQGFWNAQAIAAAFDIEEHPGTFGVMGGKSIIVDPPDGKIPYQPWALARKKETAAHHMYDDPEAHCISSGIPRQTYAPFGLQILQPPGDVLILYEAYHVFRIIPTDGRPHVSPHIRVFEGDSRGHWEGGTFVVDVTNQTDRTWFDMAGNFHSDAIHVVERYTMLDSNTIRYEAKIEDPKVYTRPWTMAFNLARNWQPGYQLLEFACPEGERDLQHYTEKEGGKKN